MGELLDGNVDKVLQSLFGSIIGNFEKNPLWLGVDMLKSITELH